MPGVALSRDKLPTESSAVLGNVTVFAAYALISSGHLPLMMPMILLALLGEGLVARVAWAENCLKAQHVRDLDATSFRNPYRGPRPTESKKEP